MQMLPLGQSGIDASVVAFGAWAIGGWMWGGNDESDSIKAIHASIDAGANFIDTAAVYGKGVSEEIVGKAIEGRRDEVVLATKCGLRWDTKAGEFHFNDLEGDAIHKYLDPKSLEQELEDSLRRLKVDVIDLYQTHWQTETTPIEETMACLMKMKEAGKIRAIGVSNATPAEMDRYRAVGPLDTDQEKYSMLDRGMEAEQLPYCEQNNIAVLAYSPMAMGLLTGKIGPERVFSDTDIRSTRPRFSVDNRARVAAMLDEMKPIADQHDINFAQLSVAWAFHQPGLTHALVGARNAEQAAANAKAGSVKLSADDLATLNSILAKHSGEIE